MLYSLFDYAHISLRHIDLLLLQSRPDIIFVKGVYYLMSNN